MHNEVFPKCFYWIKRIQWQKYLSWKEFEPVTSCVRNQDDTSKTRVRGVVFKFSPIHASVIYQIPWIRWIHWNI